MHFSTWINHLPQCLPIKFKHIQDFKMMFSRQLLISYKNIYFFMALIECWHFSFSLTNLTEILLGCREKKTMPNFCIALTNALSSYVDNFKNEITLKKFFLIYGKYLAMMLGIQCHELGPVFLVWQCDRWLSTLETHGSNRRFALNKFNIRYLYYYATYIQDQSQLHDCRSSF